MNATIDFSHGGTAVTGGVGCPQPTAVAGGHVIRPRASRIAKSRRHAAISVAVLVASLAFAGCGRQAAPVATSAPVQHVRTVPVAWTDEAIPVTAQGVLARKTEAALSFKIGGVIRTVNVRAGDHVKEGATLAALDLDEIEAEVTRAQATVDKAARDVARVDRLHGQNVATLEQAQDARTGLEMAQAALRAAEFNRRFAVITAPADGVVLDRLHNPDELTEPGKPVLHFAADAEPWIVRAGLTERELRGVHPGSTGVVQLTDHAPVAAVVAHIAGMADPMTRTIPVEFELQHPPADLRSGFVAQVIITPDPVERRPAVPLESLVAGDGHHAHVFLLQDGGHHAHRMDVEIEALNDGTAYLKTSLPEGASLITTGAEFLIDGAAVEVEK